MVPPLSLRTAQTYAGAAVVVGALALALMQSRPQGPLPETHPTPVQTAQEFYAGAAQAEAEARKKAGNRFRGSPWSQEDEAHNKEARFIRVQARTRRTSVPDLILALDRGMREHWSTAPYAAPSQKVLPCRPRLSY